MEREHKYQRAGEIPDEVLSPKMNPDLMKGYSPIEESEGMSTITDLGVSYRELQQALNNQNQD